MSVSHQELMQLCVQSSNNGITIVDAVNPDLPIVFANQAFYRLTGYTPESVLGKNCRFLQGPKTEPGLLHAMRHAIDNQESFQGALTNYRADGTTFRNQLNISPVFDHQNTLTHFIGVQTEVTDHDHLNQRVQFLLTRDSLTGLPNRKEMLRLLSNLDYHGFYGCLRLVNLPAINAIVGYKEADKLIRGVAGVLQGIMPSNGLLARSGAKHFGFWLPSVELASAQQFAEAAVEAVDRFVTNQLLENVSIRIGCAIRSVSVHTNDLFRHIAEAEVAANIGIEVADRLVTLGDDETAETTRRLKRIETVRTAIMRGNVDIAIQPIISTKVDAGKPPPMHELLVRPVEPTGIGVSDFIQIAEHNGMHSQLDQYMVEVAEKITEEHDSVGVIMVNLSGRSLSDKQFVAWLLQKLKTITNVGRRLGFEITETVAMANPGRVIDTITVMRELGCPVAIDDFGTGYATFGYLRALPVSLVKIDGQFIQGLPNDEIATAVIRSVVDTCRKLNIKTVAEHVETEQQKALLQSIGTDYLQGFLVGAPSKP